MVLLVDDDGSGLSNVAVIQALVPGRRLHERGDGHGFGLSITEELAELNGGKLSLLASPLLSGLRASLMLPVIGVDKVGDDIAAGFLAMSDPVTGRAWDEDRLRVQVEFGEVTWIIQCDDLTRVPPSLLDRAAHVAFTAFPRGIETVAKLSIMLEVIDDLGLDEADPALNWSKVVRHLGGHHSTAQQLYREMAQAVFRAARREEPSSSLASPY